MTERTKQYLEANFPRLPASLAENDPEFWEFFTAFAFDEVVRQDALDDRTRFMAILSALLGCQGTEAFRAMLPEIGRASCRERV